MTNLIGVGDEDTLARLKQWLLLVDRLVVVHGPEDWTFRSSAPGLAADLDWLSDQGLVSKTNLKMKASVDVDGFKIGDGKIVLVPGTADIMIRGSEFGAHFMNVGQLADGFRDVLCRIECETIRASGEVDAVSLKPPSRFVVRRESIPMTAGDVIEVVIGAMPEPDGETALDQILDFKADEDARGKLLALRRWASGIAKKNFSKREVSDELEWLLHEYESHMRIHRMKVNRGFFETVVTTTGEALEDIAKIKIAKLAKLPFAVRTRRIEMLEAELKAPGREIAYVAHANDRLKRLTPHC